MDPMQADMGADVPSSRGGAIMNSDERRQARYLRRQERRKRNRAKRLEGLDIDAVADLDNLRTAAHEAARGVRWKASTQRYMAHYLGNIVKAQDDILNGREICRGFYNFDLWERGKLRHISSVHFSERVIHKSLTQNVLIPAIAPSLIHANSANVKGKGTDFAIRLLKRQLAKHYRLYGTEGYILQIDFKDYFANIDHAPLIEMLNGYLDDPKVIDLATHLIEVQGDKGLGLGSEPNQIEAVSYPNRIDHHVLECCHVEAYGRYMDDSYAIHIDKDHLRSVLLAVERLCQQLGITINHKKTKITKLSRGFTFLKKRFFYAENGKIIVKPARSTVTRHRRKLRRLHKMYLAGEVNEFDVWLYVASVHGFYKHCNACHSWWNFKRLCNSLFGDLML